MAFALLFWLLQLHKNVLNKAMLNSRIGHMLEGKVFATIEWVYPKKQSRKECRGFHVFFFFGECCYPAKVRLRIRMQDARFK